MSKSILVVDDTRSMRAMVADDPMDQAATEVLSSVAL